MSSFSKFAKAALAVAVSHAFLPLASAQQADAKALDSIVVTATRSAQTQDETLAAVTVIDRQEIDRLQPASVQELLRGRAGITFANNGGAGKATSLFLRGTESDHVLVLVDGVKIGSATSGGASLQDIPVEQIERIEIVRGPFSSLYGSEAIGGVVQIFTRKPQGPFSTHGSVALGSERTRRLGAGIGGRSQGDGAGSWYAVQVADERTDGIDARRDNPASSFDNRAIDPDLDGYRNRSVTAQAGYRFSQQWDADARVFHADAHNEYDGGPASESDAVQQVMGGSVRYQPATGGKFTASIARSKDKSDNYTGGVFDSRFNTTRSMASLQGDIELGDNGMLTLGYDWQRDEVDSTTRYFVNQRINKGVFAQWQQRAGAHALQASVRRDDDGQFGAHATGSLMWGWDVSPALRVGASYGTAYKAPTFNELYFPGFGNPLLVPESSRSFEASVSGTPGWGRWSLNAFDTRIDDMIAFDSSLGQFGGANNIDRAHIRGVEAVMGLALMGWDVNATVSWTNPENAGASSGKQLARRARQSGRIDMDRTFGAFSVGASVSGAGERFDNLTNTIRMPGYGLTSLRAGYALGDAWSLRLSLDNVFDKRYETAAFYRQPGRNWLLTLRYAPTR